MKRGIQNLQDGIDRLVLSIVGTDAPAGARRKARLFLGVVAIIAANVWLGPMIGHGIAALLGAGAFFVVGLGGGETCGEDK